MMPHIEFNVDILDVLYGVNGKMSVRSPVCLSVCPVTCLSVCNLVSATKPSVSISLLYTTLSRMWELLENLLRDSHC
jgi:hypothetical protein